MKTKWDGVIIITGDINIDLAGEQKESTKRYQNILHSFNLRQHITKPTWKGKSLIDYICSNVPKKLIHNHVIYTDEISDHDTPFVILNIKKNVTNHAINTLEMKEKLIWINMSMILVNYLWA